MIRENALALIVSYYLSRFDRVAYQHLGFDTLTGGHQAIGSRLNVNPNTVKNMRDEFDSIHDNPRVGWYQREIRPSRQRVVETFEELEEFELRSIVEDILQSGPDGRIYGLDAVIDELLGNGDEDTESETVYIVRGPTGRKAEEFFMKFHSRTGQPRQGELIDTRDRGCGYDFEIRSEDGTVYVEVKGLRSELGGMLFTAKEWEMARGNRERYYLALVRNLADQPELEIIHNPAKVFIPRKSVTTTVQVRWQIGQDEISTYLAKR